MIFIRFFFWKSILSSLKDVYFSKYFLVCKKKKPVDFDDELKIGDVWYDNMTKITIKVQLFWTFTIWNVTMLKY